MRILLMSASYPPVLGGLQTAAHSLACNLNAQGHEVLVLTNRYPRTLKSRETLDGVRVHRRLFARPRWADLRNRRADLWLASLYYFPATMRYTRRLVDAFQPDVVNLHFPDALIPFARQIKREGKFKLVVSLHGDEILRWFRPSGGRFDDIEERISKESKQLEELASLLHEADAVTAVRTSS